MHETYASAVVDLLQQGVLDAEDNVLVACGGCEDRTILTMAGIRNATITNLNENWSIEAQPYKWATCDAENLPFADNAFDWGFVHAGLHHCQSPHRALVELLRVSRKGVLVIEARDSAIMRFAVGFGLTLAYETDAVVNGGGGLRNGPIPNYIYRWTEREVFKTVESALPGTVNPLRFFYGLRLPDRRMACGSIFKRHTYRMVSLAARAIFALIPQQGNEFGFAIIKTNELKPWMRRGQRFACEENAGALNETAWADTVLATTRSR